MKIAIAFFAGCITFVLMMLIKIPIKKIMRIIAGKVEEDDEEQYVLYKRLNGIIVLVAMMLAMICSYMIYAVLGIEHFKVCYALKAGAISVALYALYEQWFGEE